ncbi:MAG: hypothetical protein IBX62_02690 [Coriobacteriia bacterium]|nr:hypothetical protein [Coriobacteriia bacterium]
MDRENETRAPGPGEPEEREGRVTTPEEERREWIDEDLAADPEYRRAQREAGGDATTPMTGRVPVGEVPPLEERPEPGDLSDEIPSTARNAPGTVDDIPLSLGDDRPGYKPPLEPLATGDEETDLWQMQQPLIDEDRETSVHLEGFSEEEAEHVMEVSGDDAEPQAQGYSVTGSPFGPDHGGFRERREGEGGRRAKPREEDAEEPREPEPPVGEGSEPGGE